MTSPGAELIKFGPIIGSKFNLANRNLKSNFLAVKMIFCDLLSFSLDKNKDARLGLNRSCDFGIGRYRTPPKIADFHHYQLKLNQFYIHLVLLHQLRPIPSNSHNGQMNWLPIAELKHWWSPNYHSCLYVASANTSETIDPLASGNLFGQMLGRLQDIGESSNSSF